MNSARQPTHRATLEGSDSPLDLRSLLAELADYPSLTSHLPPASFSFLTLAAPHSIGAALTSPYRKADFYPKATPNFRVLPFSKQTLLVDLLGAIDIHGEPDFKSRHAPVDHLEIDLLQPPAVNPETRLSGFKLHDLAPLTLFRHLAYLKVGGMTRSYQSQIWQCVWLNPHLHSLILSMSIDGEIFSFEKIRVARLYADLHLSMRQTSHVHQRACVPEKLSVVKLELTNFIIGSKPFEWFDGRKLKEVRFVECTDAGFRLSGDDWRTTTVITVARKSKVEQTSTNLMSPRKRRPSMVDRMGEGSRLIGENLTALRDM